MCKAGRLEDRALHKSMNLHKSACPESGLHKSSDVPYEAVDIEIRRLVWLMNQLPGIRTISSCSGHAWPSPEAGIVFSCGTQDDLSALIAALPPLGWHGGFIANQSQWDALTITVSSFEQTVSYSLQIDGYPQHVQRALISKVEKALETAIPT